jgi:hypothetical protein
MCVPTNNLQEFFQIQVTKQWQNNLISNYFNKSITKHETLCSKQPISSLFFDQIECFL